MLEHFKEVLGEEKFNEILEESEGKTYEELLNENKQLKQINAEHQKLNGELRSCISKAYDWVVKYQTEYCQYNVVISDLSQLKEILQSKEGR